MITRWRSASLPPGRGSGETEVRALVAAPGMPGGIELREVPEPRPSAIEAVVEVRAVSLNRGECTALRQAEDGWRPGWDLAGIVVQQGVNMLEVAGQVQQEVTKALDRMVGIPAREVNVHIQDVQ